MEEETELSELVIYVKDGCPYCREALEYLEESGAHFSKINVTDDDEALDDLEELTGRQRTPALVYGKEALSDCDPEQIEEFLHAHDLI